MTSLEGFGTGLRWQHCRRLLQRMADRRRWAWRGGEAWREKPLRSALYGTRHKVPGPSRWYGKFPTALASPTGTCKRCSHSSAARGGLTGPRRAMASTTDTQPASTAARVHGSKASAAPSVWGPGARANDTVEGGAVGEAGVPGFMNKRAKAKLHGAAIPGVLSGIQRHHRH